MLVLQAVEMRERGEDRTSEAEYSQKTASRRGTAILRARQPLRDPWPQMGMSHPTHRDAIQRQVVEVLRKIGLSVYDAAHAGNGFPDLVVGLSGATYLVELKTGKAPLRASQVDFASSWRGSPIVVLRSVTEAIDWAVGLRRRKAA